MKKFAQSQMKNIPPEAQEKMMKLITTSEGQNESGAFIFSERNRNKGLIPFIEENPELLSMVAGKAQEKIKEGKSQMQAMMEVMEEHKDELRKALE